MAELPGWDRDRLAVAPPRDVEAARLLVYARARAPEIRRDLAGDITRLERIDHPISKVTERAERSRAVEELRAAQRVQADLRALLELDDEDVD